MSRRHRADKREILPDPKFGNVVVTKFMNSVMHAGKKSVAELIVYGALDMIEGVADRPRAVTLGADKGYDAADFVEELRAINVRPHVARNTSGEFIAQDSASKLSSIVGFLAPIILSVGVVLYALYRLRSSVPPDESVLPEP